MKSKRSSRKPSKEPTRAKQRRPVTSAQFPIVGVGASAGGLEAFDRLLRKLPARTGMAFVLVQHLGPKHESQLTEILSRATSMNVAEARDGMRLAPNHVYIIPPNATMSLRGSVLQILPRRDLRAQYMPVDFFFSSLAKARRNRAIGVILSGTASDGASGMKAIKEEGGITFAQDAGSAKYFGMPHSSIASGAVDFVLPPEGIAEQLARIGRHPYVALAEEAESLAEPAAGEGADAMGQIFRLLKKTFRVDFSLYKSSTTERRIRRRMALNGVESLDEYLELLESRPEELRDLYQDMFIGVTKFFRDPDFFQALRKQIFPKILKDRAPDSPIRIWVPGCSSGEEVYSIAIYLHELLKEDAGNARVQIFGSDINAEAIKKARLGSYPETIERQMDKKRLRRYFMKTPEGYQVNKQLRDWCVFVEHDILRNPPFSRLDLLCCRNVLIYLGPRAHQKLMPLFHYSLKPTGFLCLGNAESIGAFHNLFTMVHRKRRIYAKKPVTVPPRIETPPPFALEPVSVEAVEYRKLPSSLDLQKETADMIVLNQYAPASVLVNESMEILQFRGHTGSYLEPAPGLASLNLFKMAREGLLAGLRNAVQSALKKDAPARVEGLVVEFDGQENEVNIHVIPVKAGGLKERSLLVLFEDASATRTGGVAGRRVKATHALTPGDRSAQLRQELTSTKAYLQSVIEAQEASNEELRSLNEEIMSTNEELQSTTEELETANEELQSANEELTTLNEELQHSNSELSVANNDVLNLLSSMELSVIMLDRNLRVRRFTSTAQKRFNLFTTDLGRTIGEVRLPLDAPEMDRLLPQVLETGKPGHLDSHGRDGAWYSIEVRPYLTSENQIDGAILDIADVNDLKQRNEQLRLSEERWRNFVEFAPEAMIIINSEGTIRVVNAQLENLLGYGRNQLIGQPVEILLPEGQRDIHKSHRIEYLRNPTPRPMGVGLEISARRKDGSTVPVEISLSPAHTQEGLLTLASMHNLTRRRQIEEELKEAAVARDRAQLARDMHDTLIQRFTVAVIQLEGADQVLNEDPAAARQHIAEAIKESRAGLAEARRSILALHTSERRDLSGSIHTFAQELANGKAAIEFSCQGDPRALPAATEENLFRIAQEALRNAIVHGKPTKIRVLLAYEPTSLRLVVEDDGSGFSASARRRRGRGLDVMKERAEQVGAKLSIQSGPRNGTQVELIAGYAGEPEEATR